MDKLIDNIFSFRKIWLKGPNGSGKTALCVELALRMVSAGYVSQIVTNTPLSLVPDAVLDVKDVPEVRDCCIIMDEAWQYLESGAWKSVKDWMAFPRMRDQVYLLPSVINLTSQVRHLFIRRLWNGYPMGFKVWFYHFWIDGSLKGEESKKNKAGRLIWWNPHTVFPWYNTAHEPGKQFYLYRAGVADVGQVISVDSESGVGVEG